MKKQRTLKALSLFLAIVMLVLALPANVFAVSEGSGEAVSEGNATTNASGLKDYSLPSNDKHAYDPFAQLETEEATKAYREAAQYEAGSIIYKVNETKGWFGGYKDVADGDLLSAAGIDLSSAEELSRKKVDNGVFTDTYEVIYAANLDGDVWEAVDALAETDGVVDAQPNYLYEDTAMDVPTEISRNPHRGKQWHHDWLKLDDRWKDLYDQGITAGEGAIVAVIDTGVDYTHNDLLANMWVNTAELNGTAGADDDGNGYVDDIYGVSTVGAKTYHSGDPMDDHGHGTHVAGIIAMTANNDEGGVGVSYGTKIMAIKAGQATGVFSDTDIAEAINYAVAMGADVINMSFGGTGKSFLVEEALANAFGTCVLVAAAGNDGLPTSDAPEDFMKKADYYPAGYSYVLGVMASDQNGDLASFSNWDYYNNGGSAEYEITAPGVDIWSTLPGNQYAAWDGTSMACPMVAAAAALIRSKYSDRSTYSSRFIMGQLASATDLSTVYADKIGEAHTYGALDIESSLNDLPAPNLTVKNTYLFDDPDVAPENDGDGIIDAGETIDLGIVLRNQWGMAGDVTVKVDAISHGGVANPNIEWITDTIEMENVGTFNEQNNSFVYEDDMLVGTDNPIRFKVKSDTINDANIGFNITITCKNALDEIDNETYIFNPDGFELKFYVQRGRSLSGTIKSNMTLTSDDYWIIENSVYIPKGVTVTVEPGTQIQFWPSNYDETSIAYIDVDGEFWVNGTEESPVDMFPSRAFQFYGVDIRGSSNINMEYVNVINPLLSFGEGDHLNIIQNSQVIIQRFLKGSTIKENSDKDYSRSSISFYELRNSKLVNVSVSKNPPLSTGSKESSFSGQKCISVIFENCFLYRINGTLLKFENCSFLGGEVHIYPGRTVRHDGEILSSIFTFDNKKYVLVQDLDFATPQTTPSFKTLYFMNNLAVKRGGTLACINSDAEEDFLISLVKSLDITGYVALGGYRPNNSSEWTWVDPLCTYSIDNFQTLTQYAVINASSVGSISELPLMAIFEFPSEIPDEEIACEFTLEELSSAADDAVGIYNFTNNFAHNVQFTTNDSSFLHKIFVINNYWGTTNERLIQSMITDGDTYAGLADIVTDPILTLDSPELENIYPFVTEAYITDADGNRITSASTGQEVALHVKFNRDMDTSVLPMVSFGPAEPYTDYVVDGAFVSAREWVGVTKVNGFIDAGMEFIRVKDAVAADDAWLKTGTDAARFVFEINSTGAEALTLQAVGGENKIELTWTQDDYDTLAGFNVYRSNKADGTFTKINTRLIPGTIREYVDTDVVPGQEYFYYFTVMGTDLVESNPSNTAAATPIDNVKPILTHTRVLAANSGVALPFTAKATDNIGVDYVTVFYRTTGETKYKSLNMVTTETDSYYGVISAGEVTAAGLEYYIEISDGVSVVRDGSAAYPIKVSVDNSTVIYSVTPSKVDVASVADGITAILTGVNFSDGMTLKVGGKAVEYTFVSDTQLSFTIPAGNLGRTDVTLSDGTRTARLTNAITYTDENSEAQIIAPGEAKAREEIKLPITVTANGEIISLDLQLKLDKSLFSAIRFEKADALGSAFATQNVTSKGIVKISIASIDAMDLSGPVGYLCLTPANLTEATSTSIEMVSALANAISVETLVDTSLEIKPNFTFSGKVTYYAGGEGIAGVKVSLNNGMFTYTDENGCYTFTGVTTNYIVITLHHSGSVNNAISAQDASVILSDITAESSSFGDLQYLAADVDGDGLLTAHDAAYILQKSVGKITDDFPGTGSEWAFTGTTVLNLTGDVSNVDFTGVLLGDVTGDWTATPVEEMD